jgi:1,4-dihydroxy-2-naphthoyl-CoA hydrolase
MNASDRMDAPYPPPLAPEEANSPFGDFLGVKITVAMRDRAEAELVVRPELANRNGVMHGGALMALADSLAGSASFVGANAAGYRTTTIESKTNFFRAIGQGETAYAVTIPLHRGRTTIVWQTTITRSDGKVAVIVTQTQLVLP